MVRHYDWSGVFSRQTGRDGEICAVIGGKGIGKTFGLRKQLIQWFIDGKRGRFVEFSRSMAERDSVANGYFDRLQELDMFPGYMFHSDSEHGYVSKFVPDGVKPGWQICMYFAALSKFQIEKRRTFSHVGDFVFDEFIIDAKDRFHHYLPDEFSILANLMDSISREQPGDETQHRLYMMANACDLSCPHMRALGINKLPEYGYSFHRGKMVLLHYVEPWDAAERKAETLVGRMLEGSDESKMVFDNLFDTSNADEIAKRPHNAKYAFGFIFKKMQFSIWADYSNGLFYVDDGIPRGSKAFALTRKDSSLDYNAIRQNDDLLKLLSNLFYAGMLRYTGFAVRESLHDVLAWLGIR